MMCVIQTSDDFSFSIQLGVVLIMKIKLDIVCAGHLNDLVLIISRRVSTFWHIWNFFTLPNWLISLSDLNVMLYCKRHFIMFTYSQTLIILRD